jgi:uncharacterized membrane protein
VLFIMISNHYAGTFGHHLNWLVLALIATVGVGIRHWFNIRHLPGHNRWILPLSLLLLAGLVFLMRPPAARVAPGAEGVPTTAEVMPVIRERCSTCHAAKPTHAGFPAPPLGVILEDEHSLETQASRVYQSTVATRTMPLGNITGMTDEERDLLARWYAGL